MTNKELFHVMTGMAYGMGIMLIAVNLGMFPIDGSSMITGIVSVITGMLLFKFDDQIMQKLGVAE